MTYEFNHHVTTSQRYGPSITIDSCSDGTIWLRGRGNGASFDCSFSALQAQDLASGLQAAIDAALSAGHASGPAA